MKTTDLIEIFPGIEESQDDCCDADSNCCDDSQDYYEESTQLKEQLKTYFNGAVSVTLYNYAIPMDRVLAQKKLSGLMKEKGFDSIEENTILKIVTPAIVVNGRLVSFATKPSIETILNEIDLINN